MNKSFLLFLLLCLFLPSASLARDVNGELYDVDDKTILKVWGNHYERGYAHGYLLAEVVVQEIDRFFFRSLFGGNTEDFSDARDYFFNNFVVERKYQDEVHGIYDGIVASEVDPYCQNLGRNIPVSYTHLRAHET